MVLGCCYWGQEHISKLMCLLQVGAFFMKFIPRAWRLLMHLCTPFGHFAKEICLLLFLDRNGREGWVCPTARGCWWSSGTMMQAEIPIHPEWTQANTSLETVLSAGGGTLSFSPEEKRSLWELKCSSAGHRQEAPRGAVTVLQSGSWSSLWCTGSLPGLGVYTPALQEHR